MLTNLIKEGEAGGYNQLIPEKVMANLPILEELIMPEIKGYSSDYLKEIISIVAHHIRKDEGDTPLMIKYLKRLVPQGDKYLYWLLELGVIKRSGHYEPGRSSYCYNFSQEYFSKYMVVLLENPKLIYRLERVRRSIKSESIKANRGHNEQVKYLYSITLDDGYKDYLESTFTAGTNQYNNICASASRILNGDIFYSIDSTSRRFHSNVTNMESGLRQFIRINGESLVNIDIKNSQPYLSTIILTNPDKVSNMTNNPDFSMVLQNLKVSHSEDIKKYIDLVITGQLYEYLMQEFLKAGLELTRDETKKQVLRIMFARNRMPQNVVNRKCREVFRDCFPMVHKIFSKVRGHERGNMFTSYKRFSILLQSIESHLVTEVIIKRIYKEVENVIALTIHDSVMTGISTNKVKAVRQIMIEEIENFVGLAPTVKIEGIEGEGEIYNQYDATNPITVTQSVFYS